jgi:hypothetical protein
MTSLKTIEDNKQNLKTLIKIISEYVPDINFTYNGKPINNNTTFDKSKELSKIYYKNSSLNQFIKEIKEDKYGFSLNQYNQSCVERIYNNVLNSKCISIESYINNENIKINIINKSLNINPKITKFIFNNTYDIIIEDVEDDNDNDNDNDNDKEDLSYLGVLAASLTSTIKSEKIKDEIVSKFQKITKIT